MLIHFCHIVCLCSLTPGVGTAVIMKIYTFKIYFFWDKFHAIPEKQKKIYSNILSSSHFLLKY